MPQFIKPGSPTLQVDSLLSAPPGKPYLLSIDIYLYLFILIPIQTHSVHFSVLAFPHLSFLISFSDSGKPGSPYYNVECVVNNYRSAILHIESSFKSASPYICEKKKMFINCIQFFLDSPLQYLLKTSFYQISYQRLSFPP